MWLRELHLRAAPGLPEGLGPLELRPGLNLVLGPNASGKSTLARAVRSLLWPDGADPHTWATAAWVLEDDVRRVSLADGRARWSPVAPPLPEGAADRYRLGLVDLLAAGEVEARLAARLRVELSGGYDVQAALTAFEGSTQAPNKLVARRNAAERALREAEAAADTLAAQEGTLQQRRRARDAAAEAGRRLPLAERALALARSRQALQALDEALQSAPPALKRLQGTEAARLEELQADLHTATREQERQRRALGEARAEVARHAFEEPPTPEAVAAWRARAAALEQLAAEARTLQATLAEARAEAQAAGSQVLHRDATTPPPDALRRLEELLDALRQARAQAAADEHLLGAWEARSQEGAEDPLPLRERVDRLRRWLSTPPPPPGPGPLRLVAVALALAIGLLLALGAWLLGFTLLALLGAALAGTGLGLLLAARLTGLDPRAALLDPGEAPCTPEEAADRLRALEARLHRAEAAAHAHSRLEELRRAARRSADRLRQVEGRAEEAARALGLDPRLLPLPLARQAHALVRWDETRERVEGLVAREAWLQDDLHTRRRELDAWLGSLALETPTDDATRAQAVAAIAERLRALGSARNREHAAAEAHEAAGARIHQLQLEIDALWGRASVPEGDHEGLRARLEARARLARDQARRDTLAAEIACGQAELDPPLASLDPTAALAHLQALRQQAEAYPELAEQVATLEARIEAARRGRVLGEARAALLAVEAELDEVRSRRLSDLLARAALSAAVAVHHQAHAPPVLERARQWLGRFTHGAFRLALDPAGEGRFYALHLPSGDRRELGQLSDATRVQLLLAARLAAIEAQEPAGPLPLCLDEVLATTDPDRFAQVAGSLLELAASGRQILYFSAHPAEPEAWQAICASRGAPAPHRVELPPLVVNAPTAP